MSECYAFFRCVFVSSIFFFFKQKTAYEMRISDWSSDVCSSDVAGLRADGAQRRRGFGGAAPARNGGDRRDHLIYHFDPARTAGALPAGPWAQREDGRRGTRITTTGTEHRHVRPYPARPEGDRRNH